jgi:uncharacterized protein YecE (DUF72 family)
MIQWHIGCSGFHYKDWKCVFYPKEIPQRKWFEYYAEHFNTLELNVTFYRFPKVPMLKSWYDRSPANFTFAVKAPRAITHFKKLNDCGKFFKDFYQTVEKGLKEKAACILFQFPPNYCYTENRLEKIVSNLYKQFSNIVEFRHYSWWNENVYKTLEQHKITFCGMSHPLLPDKVIANSPILYYRMHGVPDLYRSSYSTAYLKKIVHEIKSQAMVKQAFIYFNNDYDAVAIRNANEMKAIVNHK